MSPRSIGVAIVVVLLATIGVAAGRAAGAGGVVDAGRVLSIEHRPDGAYDLRYRSTSVSGKATTETAVLWMPEGERNGEVVAWGHPTAGLADHCAPSVAGNAEPPGLDELLVAGTTVVAPDYEGLGGPGVHPYLVGRSEGRSMLDALRAARSVSGATGRSVAFGWSQGGHAALFAGRLAPSYAPDVRLVGVAALAPVTDPASLVVGPSVLATQPGIVAMVAAGYKAAYPSLDTSDVLADPKSQLEGARTTCEAADVLKDTTTWLPTAAWRDKLEDNDAGALGRIRVPVLIAQSEDDTLTPTSDTVRAYRRLCGSDSAVHLERWRDTNHFTVAVAAKERLLEWLGDRLDGRPAAADCSQRTFG